MGVGAGEGEGWSLLFPRPPFPCWGVCRCVFAAQCARCAASTAVSAVHAWGWRVWLGAMGCEGHPDATEGPWVQPMPYWVVPSLLFTSPHCTNLEGALFWWHMPLCYTTRGAVLQVYTPCPPYFAPSTTVPRTHQEPLRLRRKRRGRAFEVQSFFTPPYSEAEIHHNHICIAHVTYQIDFSPLCITNCTIVFSSARSGSYPGPLNGL